MIRGWLAILGLMGYGALNLGFFAVLVFHNSPAFEVSPNAGTLTTSSILPVGFDWLYPIALLWIVVHATIGALKLTKVIDAYAWDHRD